MTSPVPPSRSDGHQTTLQSARKGTLKAGHHLRDCTFSVTLFQQVPLFPLQDQPLKQNYFGSGLYVLYPSFTEASLTYGGCKWASSALTFNMPTHSPTPLEVVWSIKSILTSFTDISMPDFMWSDTHQLQSVRHPPPHVGGQQWRYGCWAKLRTWWLQLHQTHVYTGSVYS